MGNRKALVLFSGGLDSATTLSHALKEGYDCSALTINYNQRHSYEVKSSEHYLKDMNVRSLSFNMDLTQIGGSALTDSTIKVPDKQTRDIPVTYVPARNTIFLSIAAAYAEKLNINSIFIGVNQIDYSGYPDCRPEYIDSVQKTINMGTKSGVTGKNLVIHTPLINMTKKDIILYGVSLGVDYSKTVSCYQLDKNGLACGKCDACFYRKEGFNEAGVEDPTKYKN